mmetsp:Transcript_37977/g.88782  ORF Transcript_37977/g.88782 Transcript_37977/m.88782 type:complete len:270 (-) Transcript_37977:1089-1898(-)
MTNAAKKATKASTRMDIMVAVVACIMGPRVGMRRRYLMSLLHATTMVIARILSCALERKTTGCMSRKLSSVMSRVGRSDMELNTANRKTMTTMVSKKVRASMVLPTSLRYMMGLCLNSRNSPSTETETNSSTSSWSHMNRPRSDKSNVNSSVRLVNCSVAYSDKGQAPPPSGVSTDKWPTDIRSMLWLSRVYSTWSHLVAASVQPPARNAVRVAIATLRFKGDRSTTNPLPSSPLLRTLNRPRVPPPSVQVCSGMSALSTWLPVESTPP